MSYFLGQHLSERWFDKGSADPVRHRVWLALRYLTIVLSVIVFVLLLGRSPGGALLTGLGGGAALSGLLNVLLLPRDQRSPRIDVLLLIAGTTAAAAGLYLLTTS